MRLLGDNGAGYELAQKLEENSTWRTWLGERDYAAIQPYLATPGTWSAFMQSENPSALIALQLRVRALLFDKAVASLYVESAASAQPSALDNSYLQLHVDSVYFSLEQDAEDWARLQAEKSPAMASLELKYGLAPTEDPTGGHGGTSSRRTQFGHSVSSALISPKQHASRTHAKMGYNHTGSAMDFRSMGELWYTQYLQKNLMNRMNRLAYRAAQQRLSFGDQEACLRTPTGMAEYVTSQANHRKRRLVLQSDGDLKSSNRGPSSTTGCQNLEGTDRDVFVSKPIQPGHERSIQEEDEDAPLMPEIHFIGNCVPDNPVPAQHSSLLDGSSAHGDFLDRLNHLQNLSSGLFTKGKDRLGPSPEVSNRRCRDDTIGPGISTPVGRKRETSEEAAQQLAQQAVVRLVAAAGFEGLKQAPLQILVDLLACHMRKLGSGLRLIVDTYKKECSQAELLNMYIHGASGSNVGQLMAYAKTLQQSQKRRPAPIQMPQPTIQQALAQRQLSPHPATSVPLKMMPYQQCQTQHLQPQGQDKLARRWQPFTPGGSNKGNRLERVGSDTKMGEEVGSEASGGLTNGLAQMVNQTSSQGHMSWNPQAPNFMGLSQVHQPPVLQHFKQQLSSLQIPSLQHQMLYAKDSGSPKLPLSREQEIADLSMNLSMREGIKHEEGVQMSPGMWKQKQHQRNWASIE